MTLKDCPEREDVKEDNLRSIKGRMLDKREKGS